MKKLLPVLIAAAFIAGCNDTKESKTIDQNTITSNADTMTALPPAGPAGCYQMTVGKDTAYLELKEKNDSLHGTLVYNRFEKDSNTGTVHLKKQNDRLDGWYAFQSEGVTSVRQIVFRAENGSLEEGYGDLVMRGDSAAFKYPATLRFEDKHPFNKVTCK